MSTSPPGSRSRWKTLSFSALLLGASLTFTAGLAEVCVRTAAPQQLVVIRPDLWEPADSVGWLRRPDVNAEINTGERTVRLITDHEGFRIGRNGRTEGVPILLLGDSFVEALQVEHEQSLAGLLEGSVSSAVGQTVAVRNAGVSGWGPGQYLSRARTLLARDSFALIITAIYVGNDAQPVRVDYMPPRPITERHRFRLPRSLSKSELVDAVMYPINDVLEVRSHLFVLLRSQLSTLRMKLGLSPLYLPKEILKSEAAATRWTIAAELCREMSEMAAAHGSRILFVLVPADYQVEAANFSRYAEAFGIDRTDVDLDQPNRRLYEELTRRGLHVVDALPGFRERERAGISLYGTVDQHLSPDGHQALAELVTPVVAGLLNVPALAARSQRLSSTIP